METTPVIARTAVMVNPDKAEYMVADTEETVRNGLYQVGYQVITSPRTGANLYVKNTDLLDAARNVGVTYKSGYAWKALPVYGVETVVNLTDDGRPVVCGAVGAKRRWTVKVRCDLVIA